MINIRLPRLTNHGAKVNKRILQNSNHNCFDMCLDQVNEAYSLWNMHINRGLSCLSSFVLLISMYTYRPFLNNAKTILRTHIPRYDRHLLIIRWHILRKKYQNRSNKYGGLLSSACSHDNREVLFYTSSTTKGALVRRQWSLVSHFIRPVQTSLYGANELLRKLLNNRHLNDTYRDIITIYYVTIKMASK